MMRDGRVRHVRAWVRVACTMMLALTAAPIFYHIMRWRRSNAPRPGLQGARGGTGDAQRVGRREGCCSVSASGGEQEGGPSRVDVQPPPHHERASALSDECGASLVPRSGAPTRRVPRTAMTRSRVRNDHARARDAHHSIVLKTNGARGAMMLS